MYKAKTCIICGKIVQPTHPRQNKHAGDCLRVANKLKMRRYRARLKQKKTETHKEGK